MSIVSFIVLYNGRWDECNNYVEHDMMGLVVDDKITLCEFHELVVEELGLDRRTNWHLSVNMDKSVHSNGLIALDRDKDIFWYLNMARRVTNTSFFLIVSDNGWEQARIAHSEQKSCC